jgi:1-acyl-sn-glycerol-3-phosphate acyltransferase
MRRSLLRTVIRVAAFLIHVGALVPLYLIASPMGKPWRRAIVDLFFRGCCVLTGVTVHRHGRPAAETPILYVANHVSYLDVPALGTLLDATFVAKSEVAAWPLFGWLARLSRTIFIQRSPRQADAERDLLAARLRAGDNVVLFPEGTTSDGTGLLPFKSSLFSAVGDGGATPWVQPVSIAYTRLADGCPVTPALAPLYAWLGEAEFAPHLWAVFGMKGVHVEIAFLPAVDARVFPSRKALARHCADEIARGLAWSRARAGHAPIGVTRPDVAPHPALAESEAALSPIGS